MRKFAGMILTTLACCALTGIMAFAKTNVMVTAKATEKSLPQKAREDKYDVRSSPNGPVLMEMTFSGSTMR